MDCAIRYRLDAGGPGVYLVECEGRVHVYSRGELGLPLPPRAVDALLAGRGGRWVPAVGDVPAPGELVPDGAALRIPYAEDALAEG